MIYEDIFKRFESEGVRYIVVGGVAVNLYGYARLTVDLDLMVDLDEENMSKIVRVMEDVGYKPRVPVAAHQIISSEEREQWVRQKGTVVFTFVDSQRPYRNVDIFLTNPIDFEKAYARSRVLRIRDLSIRVASIDDLVTMKKGSGRPRDLEDIAQLEKLKDLARHMKDQDDS